MNRIGPRDGPAVDWILVMDDPGVGGRQRLPLRILLLRHKPGKSYAAQTYDIV